MHNDRDLLELAAKAAGYDVVWNEHWKCYQHRNPVPDKFGTVRHPWIPLTDDGDALRLAAVLEMEVSLGQCGGIVYRRRPMKESIEEISEDYMSAIRLAIVRAAAAIGEVM